ncbi:hypothetical protein [Pseudomonas mediterranea]
MSNINYISNVTGLSVTEKYSLIDIQGKPHLQIEVLTEFDNPYYILEHRRSPQARLVLFPTLAAQVADIVNNKINSYPVGEIATAGICVKTCSYGSKKGSKILFGKQFLDVLQGKMFFTRPIPVSFISPMDANPDDMIVSRRQSSRLYRSTIKIDVTGLTPDHGRMSAIFQFSAPWQCHRTFIS